MKRAVLAMGVLGLAIFSAVQMTFVAPVNAGAQQLTEFRIAQAASDNNKSDKDTKASGKTKPDAAKLGTNHGSAVNGGECIRPTKEMRKNHMDMILHKRDETMYKGIRTKDASLKQCISCHAIKGDEGTFIKATDPKHFCRGCHDQVAVRIDCFDCHASRPEVKKDSAHLNPHQKRLSPFALVQDKKATATALNSFLGGQANDKK